MTTRIVVTRKFDVEPLLTIHHPQFANWYSHGVWWAIYGDFQGHGVYEDHYLIDNVLRNMGYGWYDQPLSDALLSSGFYLGMCHGGNITPKSHQLREASSILTLTDETFAAGYASGLATVKTQTDNGFMEQLHTQAINHVTEQEVAYTLGIWIGSLSHMLKNTLLPAPASEAVTSVTR